jgi:hypothetical protein
MLTSALYGFSPAARLAVDQALAEQSWDAVVFDSINGAWALPTVLRRRLGSGRPPLVYLAHNCEATAARRIADASHGLRRLVKLLDWAKTATLERRLLAEADFVTADAPEDCEALAPATKAGKVTFLPPGYDGPRVAHRAITADTPRRAVIIGSFDWLPKRESLERFLDAGVARFAAAGVELQIVGYAEPGYLAGLRRRFPQVTIVGRSPMCGRTWLLPGLVLFPTCSADSSSRASTMCSIACRSWRCEPPCPACPSRMA